MSTKSVKLEVQDVGRDLIRDAIERKGGEGKKKRKGKQQRVMVGLAMTRYQGSRQMGKVLPGGDVNSISLVYYVGCTML